MRSNKNKFEFIKFTHTDIQERTIERFGEQRIGQTITKEFSKKYIVLGIEESVGPQANHGVSGAENGFEPFLSKFLNMQANRFLSCEDVLILGKIVALNSPNSTEDAQLMVNDLDVFISDILSSFLTKGQIPIVVGGGHNNCYPILKFCSEQKQTALNVINLDPHADYRILEGRHSGNGFSYAHKYSYLKNYTVLGLHQSYNSEEMLTRLEQDGHSFSFFEDYLSEKAIFLEDLSRCKKEIDSHFYGIELDLDAIINMPSSAFTPSGFTLENARKYIQNFASSKNVAYLHLPEGAPHTTVERAAVGKSLAYLVTDFLKVHKVLT